MVYFLRHSFPLFTFIKIQQIKMQTNYVVQVSVGAYVNNYNGVFIKGLFIQTYPAAENLD